MKLWSLQVLILGLIVLMFWGVHEANRLAKGVIAPHLVAECEKHPTSETMRGLCADNGL